MMYPSFLEKTIKSFNYQVLKNNIYYPDIVEKINKTNIIVIDTYFRIEFKYIIACFDKQLIFSEIINQSITKILFSEKNVRKIHFIPNCQLDCLEFKDIKSLQSITIKNQDRKFEEYIKIFIDKFHVIIENNESIKSFWKIIQPCIFGYLIKKSFIQNEKNRLYDFLNKIEEEKNKPKIFEENEFIFLDKLGLSETSIIQLYYHVESEKLFAIKKLHQKNLEKLIQRELDNYKCINFPFVPQFYGQVQDEESIVIEYIKGQTLDKINKEELKFEQKLVIITELLYTIQYLHKNNFIYRDLKPNNLIIDQYNHIVLIDFDRMIKKSQNTEEYNKEYFTNDFNSQYNDPNINCYNQPPSFENDIYSIGRIICFLFTNTEQILELE